MPRVVVGIGKGTAKRRRYFSDDDIVGKTPSALKRLSKARQREYLRHWFFRNFEDPQEQTPYADKEDRGDSNYNYIWGGPYEAKDELWSEFGDVILENVIDEVVEEVEADGIIEWAPGNEHPDLQRLQDDIASDERDRNESDPEPDIDQIIDALERNPRVKTGDGYERQLRQEAIDALQKLKAALASPPPIHGGIRHNNPPPDLDPAESQVAQDIRQATDSIIAEIEKPEVNALVIAREAKQLKLLGGWVAKKADKFADSFVGTLGVGLAGLATTAIVKSVGLAPELTHLISRASSR